MNNKGAVLTWTMVIIVTTATAFGIATRFILKMKPDNKIEQACERVILNKTGIIVDLSPDVEERATMDLVLTTNRFCPPTPLNPSESKTPIE